MSRDEAIENLTAIEAHLRRWSAKNHRWGWFDSECHVDGPCQEYELCHAESIDFDRCFVAACNQLEIVLRVDYADALRAAWANLRKHVRELDHWAAELPTWRKQRQDHIMAQLTQALAITDGKSAHAKASLRKLKAAMKRLEGQGHPVFMPGRTLTSNEVIERAGGELLRIHEDLECELNHKAHALREESSALADRCRACIDHLADEPDATIETKPPATIITAADAEALHPITRTTIRRWVKEGKIKDHRPPGHAENAPLLVDAREVAARCGKLDAEART